VAIAETQNMPGNNRLLFPSAKLDRQRIFTFRIIFEGIALQTRTRLPHSAGQQMRVLYPGVLIGSLLQTPQTFIFSKPLWHVTASGGPSSRIPIQTSSSAREVLDKLMDPPPNYSDSSSSDASSEAGESTQTEPDFVVAIDFGTTFTGIAYLHSAAFNNQSLTTREIAQRIKVVQRWRGTTQGYTDKVPTVLSYDSDGELQEWGPSVLPTDDVTIKYFKLGLQDDVDRGYLSGNGSAIGGFLSKSDWKHDGLPNKSPLDFASEYLSEIHKYFLDEYVPSIYGPAFLQGQRVSYLITVPAIWTQKAKDLTRQAAVRAGINDLVFVTEPEAAALFCATISQEVDLAVGDRFLVCDAGGGTVVILLFYPF
jgi:hypothetical protein